MSIDSIGRRAGPGRIVAVIVLTLVTGVMTGAQLGKIAPLIGWYQQDVGLSLVAAGWLAAVLAVFIAAAAMPAGWLVERLGLERSVLIGSAALALGGVGLALSQAGAAIFVARLVEAVGYLALCIGLPAILAQVAPPAWRGPVLAIWSGFVPLGYATSDFISAAMLPAASEERFLLVMALLFAGVAAATLVSLRGLPVFARGAPGGRLADSLSPPVLLLAFSFGMFVVLSVSMFTFMPSYVAGPGSHYLVSAGAVALSVPVGNVIASVLVRGRGAPYMAGLALVGFAIGIVAAVPAFTLGQPVAATVAALVLAISGALVASAQFAAIPFVVPPRGSVPVAIGLVAQAGGIGTLFGPPAAAFVIERFGWAGLGWFLAVTGVVGLLAMLPLARRGGSVSAADARRGP